MGIYIRNVGQMTGAAAAIVEYAEELEGRLFAISDEILLHPNKYLAPKLKTVSDNKKTAWRLRDAMNDEYDSLPATLTPALVLEAWKGYYVEKGAIARNNELSVLRAKSNLSQEEFSGRLEIDRKRIYDYEAHRRNCPEELLARARKLFGRK